MVDADLSPPSSHHESLTEIRHRERIATRRDLAAMAKRIADRLEEASDRPPPPSSDELDVDGGSLSPSVH